ncbi:MAG TPA: acyl-CoA dehydrogenase family protein [Phenylobacterium sp.]|jgi:alkylation response protein AidB-like acyl-CoA dehydrogenase|uniref:acyl-CoA dehydrogenase family protein n=1 Tax=Phenylobacterium sp. TaxID=1871053 RepID=UPI002CB32C63|nr:acyl-CoA dehydrogenase family protein [Phenylobacterium sp.]HXA39253.1 acyl-CoA dehydrogenase family protein [Phenylobacterium sp.]
MNFDFSDDQKFLKAEARKFLDANCPTVRVRGVLDDGGKAYDDALWTAVAAQGWLGAAIPEEFGGLGLGHLELCAIAEELGRAVAPIPFASTVYFLAEAVMLAGDQAQKAELLPKIAAGEAIGCMATSEGPGAVTAASLKATVADGRLSGVKLPVTDGDIATVALVLAKENGKPGLFLVDLTGAGVTREPLQTLDPTRDAARLTFKDAPARRLGAAGAGLELLEQVMDRAAILLAFEQCGGADRCLEMAKAYALERYAFGRVIASYQAIKHKLADIYVKNELARSNAYYGAWALNTDAPEMPLAASAARIAASEAFWFAAKENIQTHGGIGFTWEMDCHLYYRRSRQLSLVAGAPRVWKERLVSHLERRNAA